MNYTIEDIAKAKEWKEQGFNWAARDKDSGIAIYKRKPHKSVSTWFWDNYSLDWNEFNYINSTCFLPVTWEDSEPTSLDDIIASEQKYERLTDRDIAVTLNNNEGEDMTRYLRYTQRLWELENKIEQGKLIFKEGE